MRGRPSQIGTLKLRLNFSLYGEGSHEDVSKAVHKRVPGSRHEAVGTGASWRDVARACEVTERVDRWKRELHCLSVRSRAATSDQIIADSTGQMTFADQKRLQVHAGTGSIRR